LTILRASIRISAAFGVFFFIMFSVRAASNAGRLAPPPATPAALQRPQSAGEYNIGAGDVLQITVWKEPDASVPSVVVRPDGKITMPLLKDVEVSGLTPTAVAGTVREKLSVFIRDPDVTVVVSAINSRKIYILGAVRREGSVSLNSGLTVLQALTEAGGLTEYAKRKKIYVLRVQGGTTHRLPFQYDNVIKAQKPAQDIELLPGDTIVVP
jgi:polysaccharide export outer membrane protein